MSQYKKNKYYLKNLQENIVISQKAGSEVEVSVQHDNDPKHISKMEKKWQNQERINILEWASQHPEVNPTKVDRYKSVSGSQEMLLNCRFCKNEQ